MGEAPKEDTRGDAEATKVAPFIAVRGLRKSFGKLEVLRGADLSIAKGESMVVIGGSGTGKSVLVKHIIGLLRPEAGTVTVDGQVVADLKRPELGKLRRRMGMLFQYAALFDSMNVADNVAFAMRQHTKMTEKEIAERVEEVLAMVGLSGVQEKWPAELSGGMKKRAGLARAIALGPEIILYDEPTTGLDPIIGSTICDLIVKLRDLQGVTSVMVTHQLRDAFQVAQSFVMRDNGEFVYNHIDEIELLVGTDFLVLNEGRIVFQGRQRDLFRSDEPYVRQFLEGQIPAFGR